MDTIAVDALLRLPEVCRLTGRSKWMLYADIRARVFTKPVPLGRRAVGWPASEVAALNQARIAGAGVLALQTLVDALHERRTAPTPPKPSPATTRPSAR